MPRRLVGEPSGSICENCAARVRAPTSRASGTAAGTIYKGQGKTLDRTYLYHTEHWRSAASYVALTRQRESAEVFVARETARNAGQLARQMARGEVRAASIAWPTRDELTKEQKQEAGREDRGRRLRDALTYNTRQGGTLDQVRELLSPAGRELVDALGAKIDREFRGTDAERDELKLHGVRKLAEKEAREGPVDPAYVRRQAAAWEAQAQETARAAEQAREAERTPAPLLPAWRDPTGQGRDSLGRSTSPEELARVADQAPAAVREVEAQKGLPAGCLPRSRPGRGCAGQADRALRPRSSRRRTDLAGGRAGGAGHLARAGGMACRPGRPGRAGARQVRRRRDRRQPGPVRRRHGMPPCDTIRARWSSSGRGMPSRCRAIEGGAGHAQGRADGQADGGDTARGRTL